MSKITLVLAICSLFIITLNAGGPMAKPAMIKDRTSPSSLKEKFNKLKKSTDSIINLKELKQLFKTPKLNLTQQRIEKDGLTKVARELLENPHLGVILSHPIHIKSGQKAAFLVIPNLANRFGNGDPFQFNSDIPEAEDVLLFQYHDLTQQNQSLTIYNLLYVILDQADKMIQEGNNNPHFLHNIKTFRRLYKTPLPLRTIITPIGSKKLNNKESMPLLPSIRSALSD